MSSTPTPAPAPSPTSKVNHPLSTETSVASGSDSGAYGSAEWVAIFFLFAAMVGLALIFGVIYVTARRTDRTAQVRRDLEATHHPHHHPNAHTLLELDAVVPSMPYAKLKSESPGSSCPPDQTGSYVVCVICLETLLDQDAVRRLPCHHVFHAACINKWFLKRHYTCPLCVATYYESPAAAVTEPAAVATRDGRPNAAMYVADYTPVL